MIHYHGSPLGGTRDGVARFYSGRHAFVSFLDQEDLGCVLEVCQSFALDNGAFSAWKRGAAVNWSEYTDWVLGLSRHPGFDFAIIPDVIDGTEEENDSLIWDWMASFPAGYAARAVGVPVWHYHESFSRLARLVDSWPRVALGSSGDWPRPGTANWWRRTDEAMRVICDGAGRPRCKLHGLRMLSPEVFPRMPLASADSCNAAMNSGLQYRFGQYCPPQSWQRAAVIAQRIEAENSAAVWAFDRQLKLALEE